MLKKKTNIRNILALDIGSAKICAVLTTFNGDNTELLEICSRPSRGIKKGIISDINEASASIREVLEIVSGDLKGLDDYEVFVTFSAANISITKSSGSVVINEKYVQKKNVIKLFDYASAVYVPADRKKLHAIAYDFIIDGKDSVLNPIGLEADNLDIKMNIVTADAKGIDYLIKSLAMCDINIKEIVYQPLASAEAVLTDEEKQLCVLLLDMGFSTTDIAVFSSGRLLHAATIAIGGHHFTNDLSIVLNIPYDDAERLKKQYLSALRLHDVPDKSSFVTVIDNDGEKKEFDINFIAEIIESRTVELFSIIKNELNSVADISLAMTIITGGTSTMNEMINAAEILLNIPARMGDISHVKGLTRDFHHPAYAASVGLALYAANVAVEVESNVDKQGFFSKIKRLFSNKPK